MANNSKAFENKLDRDFLFYSTLTKELFDNLPNDVDKQMIMVWLNHLMGKNYNTVKQKSDRNIYLSRLLLQMQNRKIQSTFLTSPDPGDLPCAYATFGLPTEVDGIKGFEELGFQIDSSTGGGSGDFAEATRDGRTYLATRNLPNGIMAFLAVTNNDGDEIWKPQTTCLSDTLPDSTLTVVKDNPKSPKSLFVKMLGTFVKKPICSTRESPEDRRKVILWMDKIINDCNMWIQGEDPHNPDLESLFEVLYQDYKDDPEKNEILQHPKKLRTILMKDIREKIEERRQEVSKRELILDQYEDDEYIEHRVPGQIIDDVWVQYAEKPMKETTRSNLERIYPEEIINRFFQYLLQERIIIIEDGEREATRKINELRSASMNEIKKELQKLKKVQQDYKDYYEVYKDVEIRQEKYEKELKEHCSKPDHGNRSDRLKLEIQAELDGLMRDFEIERRTQHDLRERLEEAKQKYQLIQEKLLVECRKQNCEKDTLAKKIECLCGQVKLMKRKREEYRCRLQSKTPTSDGN